MKCSNFGSFCDLRDYAAFKKISTIEMASVDVELREKTKIRQEADRMFKEDYGIDVGSTEMPAKMMKPAAQNTMSLVTNLFPVKTHQQMPIYRWDVDITIAGKNGKTFSLTKKSDSDAVAVNRKLKTRSIFKRLVAAHPEKFGKLEENYYDLESMLFTLKDLSTDQEAQDFVVDGLDAKIIPGIASANVILKKVTDRYQVDLTDFRHLTRDVANVDLSHKQFLEVVTSQYPLMAEDYVCYPGGVSFSVKEKTTPLAEGKYLGHGVQKSVRYIENDGRSPCAAVALDLKKTVFHSEINALEYLKMQNTYVKQLIESKQRAKDNDMTLKTACQRIKGLRAYTQHTKRQRVVTMDRVGPETANEARFQLQDGEEITVAAYFHRTYGAPLRFPNAPVAVERKPGSKDVNYHPLELLTIAENQRVTGELPQAVISDVIKQAAVVPLDRQQQIMRAHRDLKISTNDYVDNVGTSIAPQMMQVKGRLLMTPKVVYGRNTQIEAREGKWRAERKTFLKPAGAARWTCMMLTNNRLGEQMMHNFLNKYVAVCRRNGMQMADPIEPFVVDWRRTDLQTEIDAFMKDCTQQYKLEFVLCIQDNNMHEHKYLKFLERQYGLITQDICTRTVERCIGNASATIDNIVQKTNVKLGGLNYGLEYKSPDGRHDVLSATTMFVGLGMSHSKPPKPDATGQEPPRPASVIGFAANVLAQSFAFVGDYYFQKADRDEKIFAIVPIVTRLLEQWCEHHGGQMPKNVVFFRNGGSEGQFQMILKYEVPLIKFAIEEFAKKSAVQQQFETKFCLLVANKRHNVRFFKSNITSGGRAAQQNLQPGVVVDSGVTHPVFSEFYVNSHTTLQGTGKTPRYTVLHNDCGLTLNQLEHFVFALSHGHQIVNLTTSLPTPAYIANDYAERGMAVLGQFLRASGAPVDEYETFNSKLTFAAMHPGSKFHHCRVNA